MTEFTFTFFKDGRIVSTQTFQAETIEDAYKMADNVLRKGKCDDWEYLPLAKNNSPFAPNEGKNGTQKSPFGMWS